MIATITSLGRCKNSWQFQMTKKSLKASLSHWIRLSQRSSQRIQGVRRTRLSLSFNVNNCFVYNWRLDTAISEKDLKNILESQQNVDRLVKQLRVAEESNRNKDKDIDGMLAEKNELKADNTNAK